MMKMKQIHLPPEFKHRFFKLKIGSNWIHTRISSPEEIQELVDKYHPDDVYFSVSTWICADKVEKKHHENGKLINNIMLGSLMVIDIDAKHFPKKTLDEAFIEAVNLREECELMGLKNNMIVFTGGGYHVYVFDWEKKFIKKKVKHSKQRYRYYEYKRKKFVDILKKRGYIFDYSVSLDNHRIVRLPGTTHGKSGKTCKILYFQP